MKKEMLVTLSMVIMALVICFSVSPSAVRADSSDGQNNSPVYTYTKDKETITMYRVESTGYVYIEGNYKTALAIDGTENVAFRGKAVSIYGFGFDQYGTSWVIDSGTIDGWNYFLQYDEDDFYFNYIYEEDGSLVKNAESLVFDENNQYVVGYKTFSGEIKPLLSYDEIVKETANNPKYNPTPTPTAPSTPKPTPSSPSQPVTPVNPGVTMPVPTVPVVTPNVTPNVTPDVTTNPTTSPNTPQKLSIKKQKSKISLYVGSKLMSSYGLKKGTLTWNVGKKTGKVKNVKAAGYIKKSKNLIYITKNGKAYIISSKGKKKVILKKGARKLKFKDGFVTKVNKKSGSLNVTGK